MISTLHSPPPRPPSSLAESAYYSLSSSTPIASNLPTPTQSPRIQPTGTSSYITEPEHTITRIDMADTQAVASTGAPPLPPRSPQASVVEPGPSKVAHVDDNLEDPVSAPRYSSGGYPPVLDLKKKETDADTKADSGVVVSSPSSIKSPADTIKGTRSAFGLGPGASGPAPPEDDNAVLHARAATAESGLSTSVVQKITAAELKDAKRISKILKNEQKSEDRSMKMQIKELDKISSIQRQAAKDEISAITAHRKAVKAEQKMFKAKQKLEEKYTKAMGEWERVKAELKVKDEIMVSTKEHARVQTELLQNKTQEVDQLRTQKAADDRERQAKLLALKNPSGHATI